jgi:hypothetical protein
VVFGRVHYRVKYGRRTVRGGNRSAALSLLVRFRTFGNTGVSFGRELALIIPEQGKTEKQQHGAQLVDMFNRLLFYFLFFKRQQLLALYIIVIIVSKIGASTTKTASTTTNGIISHSLSSTTSMDLPGDKHLNERNLETEDEEKEIAIVFSDLDGTLIHYPKNVNEFVRMNDGRGIITLPPSKTGMVGCISSQTFALCNKIRKQTTNQIVLYNINEEDKREAVQLVFVSGMRSSTLISRIPYLPKADVYCCDSGGRIFYSRPVNDQMKTSYTPNQYDYTRQISLPSLTYYRRKILQPFLQTSNGDDDDNYIDDDDMGPFVLEEDIEWRNRMELLTAAGADGFVGNEAIATAVVPVISTGIADTPRTDAHGATIPVPSRHAVLWEYATLLQQAGIVLDLDGYSACFRINRKQQQQERNEDSIDLFDQLLQSLSSNTSTPNSSMPHFPFEYLASSINLGCIDIYPKSSGKKNWYVLETFS